EANFRIEESIPERPHVSLSGAPTGRRFFFWSNRARASARIGVVNARIGCRVQCGYENRTLENQWSPPPVDFENKVQGCEPPPTAPPGSHAPAAKAAPHFAPHRSDSLRSPAWRGRDRDRTPLRCGSITCRPSASQPRSDEYG